MPRLAVSKKIIKNIFIRIQKDVYFSAPSLDWELPGFWPAYDPSSQTRARVCTFWKLQDYLINSELEAPVYFSHSYSGLNGLYLRQRPVLTSLRLVRLHNLDQRHWRFIISLTATFQTRDEHLISVNSKRFSYSAAESQDEKSSFNERTMHKE